MTASVWLILLALAVAAAIAIGWAVDHELSRNATARHRKGL